MKKYSLYTKVLAPHTNETHSTSESGDTFQAPSSSEENFVLVMLFRGKRVLDCLERRTTMLEKKRAADEYAGKGLCQSAPLKRARQTRDP